MECVTGNWQPTKLIEHPKLVVKVALCHNAYDKMGFNAPDTPEEQHTTMVTAMPDTGSWICLVVWSLTIRMGISRHNLEGTTKKLVGTSSKQIALDGAIFLNLTLSDATSNRMV